MSQESEKLARKTCPDGITVRESGIKDAGLGIWSETHLKQNIMFGPYEGLKVDKSEWKELDMKRYTWKVVFVIKN